MCKKKIAMLCLLLALTLSSTVLAFESQQIDPSGYLEYTLPQGTKVSPGEAKDYILTWTPIPDTFEYHIGVSRKHEGAKDDEQYLLLANGWLGPSDVKDGSGKVHSVPFTVNDSLVLGGDGIKVNLGEMIAALGPEPDESASTKVTGYYCFIMIVPQSGKPVTQLIKLQ